METLYSIRNFIVTQLFQVPKLWSIVVHIVRRPFLISIIGIIHNDENAILVLKHSYRKNPWDLPAGWLEKSESPLSTLVREVKEETGFVIEPKRISLLGTSPTRYHMEFYVEAKMIGGTFQPSNEVSDYKWVEDKSDNPFLENYNNLCRNSKISDEQNLGFYSLN